MALSTLYASPKARWIVVDGISTLDNRDYTDFLAAYVQKYLPDREIVATSQPWMQGIRGPEILEALQTKKPLPYDWILQNRSAHIDAVVIPGLEQGKIIIQRRGPYSTFAFDRVEKIERENRLSLHNRMQDPHAVLILDAPAETIYQKLVEDHAAKGHPLDDLQNLEALTAAREEFLQMQRYFPRHPIHFVDVRYEDVPALQRRILEIIQPTLDGVVRRTSDTSEPIDIK